MAEYPIININAVGRAQSVFSSVSYSATVVADGPTGPVAKGRARPAMDKLREVVMGYADEAKLDRSRVRTTFSVDLIPDHSRSQQFLGYRAVYTMSFSGSDVGASVKLHDAITSIEGVQSPSPVFLPDRKNDAPRAAFEDAFSQIRKKFAEQCGVAGLDPDAYEVVDWSSHDYDESRRGGGKFLALDESSSAIEPGKAEVSISVTASFRRRS